MKAEQQRLPRFAVLIDADNTSPQIAGGLLDGVAKFGEASVRRIYGDFSGPQLKSWSDSCKARHRPLSAVRLHQRARTLDIALVIDAMDLLHSGRFDGFCLVSSDSDFTRLASRLREQAPTSTVSVHRKRRKVSGRHAAASSTPRTCCRRLQTSSATRRRNQNRCSRRRRDSDSEKAISQIESEDGG